MTVKQKITPSNVDRVVRCPGSVGWMDERTSDTIYHSRTIYGSDEAAQGKLAHQLAAARLRGDNQWENECMTHTLYRPKIENGVSEYIRFVRDLAGDDAIRAEDEVKTEFIHDVCIGYVDCWIDSYPSLKVIDLKWSNQWHHAFESYQLMSYAAGLARNTLTHPVQFVELYIFNAIFDDDDKVSKWFI